MKHNYSPIPDWHANIAFGVQWPLLFAVGPSYVGEWGRSYLLNVGCFYVSLTWCNNK